jgi:hypothetical protein
MIHKTQVLIKMSKRTANIIAKFENVYLNKIHEVRVVKSYYCREHFTRQIAGSKYCSKTDVNAKYEMLYRGNAFASRY